MKKHLITRPDKTIMVVNEKKAILYDSGLYDWVGNYERAKVDLNKWVILHVKDPRDISDKEFKCIVDITFALERFYSDWDKTTTTLFGSNVEFLKHLGGVAIKFSETTKSEEIEENLRKLSELAGFVSDKVKIEIEGDKEVKSELSKVKH